MVRRSSSVANMLTLAAGAAISLLVVVAQWHPRPTDHGIRLLRVTFEGKAGDRATLALRSDDLSLAGFANRSGHWFAFPGNEHLLPTPCTLLPFGNTYRDLIGGLHNLPGVALGKEPALLARQVLSATHDPATTGGDHALLRRSLALFKVVTSEAMRLKQIKEAVSMECSVAPEHLPYIEHWDTMSYEIIRAKKNGVWSGPFTELLRKSANIHSMEEALAVVDVIVDRSFDDVVMAHAREA